MTFLSSMFDQLYLCFIVLPHLKAYVIKLKCLLQVSLSSICRCMVFSASPFSLLPLPHPFWLTIEEGQFFLKQLYVGNIYLKEVETLCPREAGNRLKSLGFANGFSFHVSPPSRKRQVLDWWQCKASLFHQVPALCQLWDLSLCKYRLSVSVSNISYTSWNKTESGEAATWSRLCSTVTEVEFRLYPFGCASQPDSKTHNISVLLRSAALMSFLRYLLPQHSLIRLWGKYFINT